MIKGKKLPPSGQKNQRAELRRKAEQIKSQKKGSPPVRKHNDPAFLIQELETHQIELELQNQELILANQDIETAHQKYFELYDQAPVGYLSLNHQGEILEINLSGAALLQEARKNLIHRRLQVFLSGADIPIFNRFNDRVFLTDEKQTCTLTLSKNGIVLAEVQLEGIQSKPGPGGTPLCRAIIFDISEQTRLSRELQDSRERFRAILQAAPGVIFEADAQARYTFISDRWYEWTGVTAEDTAGEGWIRGIPPEWVETEKIRWQEIIRNGSAVDFQTQIKNADGSRRWVMVRVIPSLDPQGKVIRWTGKLTDIDELKKYEEILQARENELSLTLEAVPAMIAHLDGDCRYLTVNTQYARKFGFSPAGIIGLHISQVIGEDQWLEIKPRVDKVLAGQKIGYERKLRFPNGEALWIQATFTPDIGENDQIKGFVVHLMDIEQLKRVEEEVRLSEENYRRILETANEGIIIGSLEGEIIYANEKFADLLGYEKEELIGRIGTDFVDQTQIPQIMDSRRELKNGRKLQREFLFRRKDGSEFWTLTSSTPMLDNQGKPSGFLSMHADITDRKRAEQELRTNRDSLNRAQEVGHMGWWRMDVRRNILTWSDETFRLFEVPPGTPMTYETFLEFVHPDDRRFVDTQWAAALNGADYDLEHRIIVNQKIKWVREKAYLELNEKGEMIGGFGIVQDISEKKEAEEILRRSESSFRLLSETASRILAEKTTTKALEDLCRGVMEYLDCQVFFNFLVDETVGRLHLNAYAGIPYEEARKIEWLDYGVAVCGCAARDRERIVAEDILQTPDPRTDLVKSYGIQAYAAHPLMAGDRILGTLSFGTNNRTSFSDRELELMKTVADQVALGLERQRMVDSLEKAKTELEWRVEERTFELDQAWHSLRQISARLSNNEEIQRKKIAQEIHDSLGSTLSGVKYKLEDIIQQIEDPGNSVAVKLKELIPWVREAISESRRIQNDLSPAMLYDLGLLSTISWFIRRFESTYNAIKVTKILNVQEDDIPEILKMVIYRVIQEAFNNITKHSETDRVQIQLSRKGNKLLLEVRDYGRGFNLNSLNRIPEEVQKGLGLSGMRERVEWTNGNFIIQSEIDKGTTITAWWDLSKNASPDKKSSTLKISLA